MKKRLSWINFLNLEKKKKYFINIKNFLYKERKRGINIYPENKKIFNAFKYTNLSEVKIVILGQDPYHGLNQADGLCFSVNNNINIPPSLKNIYKEIREDIKNFIFPKNGSLIKWAIQGVLLLNTILTVEQGKPLSHSNIGWEIFTNKVIEILSITRKKIIFLLWGNHAFKKIKFIKNINSHYIMKASHPSPLSAYKGFFGCKHFSKSNKILLKNNFKKIIW